METKQAKEWESFPKNGVAIASNGCGDHLVLLPTSENEKKLSEEIYFWFHDTGQLGKIAGKVIIALEEIEISNVVLEKTEYSKAEEMILTLKSEAILKAKNQAIAMTKPLNQKVGNAIYISDFSNIVNMLSGRVSGILIRGAKSIEEKDKYEPVNIEFEKIKIETEVKATFKLD